LKNQRLILPAGLEFPTSVREVTNRFDERLKSGKISVYRPIPTGFPDLDGTLGGGLQAEDLILVGGAQGTGKTTWILQVARNVARQGALAIVVCYEHTPLYLYLRLLAQESFDPTNGANDSWPRITRDQVRDRIRALSGAGQETTRLDEVLQGIEGASQVLGRMGSYWEHLRFALGNSLRTSVDVLDTYVKQGFAEGYEQVVLIVDYLQKVHYQPPIGAPWPGTLERIGIVVQGLKDIALHHSVPVMAVAAADDEGLRQGKITLSSLWGPSLVQYECDVGIILNPGGRIDKDGITSVDFSIEKNRSGPDAVVIRLPLYGQYFRFGTEPVPAVLSHGRGG